ncbi:MAG: TonB-dependent receptor [Balneolaceae bacterium]|nr:TonB-dependent receptor [Balneolaceae bacterium]
MVSRSQKFQFVFMICLLLLAVPGWQSGWAQTTSGNTRYALPDLIERIQQETGFRFLYREALVADITLQFQNESETATPFDRLRNALAPHKLDIRVDSTYRQVVIIRKRERPSPEGSSSRMQISGQVVDDRSGERLPFATVTWNHGGEVNGVSANGSGFFRVSGSVSDTTTAIRLRCSYVGYESEHMRLDLEEGGTVRDITFRLTPERIDANELVVTGTNYDSQVGKNSAGLVDIGTFSPMGNANTVRALQLLPSAALSPALSGQMNIRGSPSDGFQILLDGLTIFNQSHLFGLLDSFNADVLQRSGFYYDIAPAQYPAPPGGTLSLVTQTGSLNNTGGTVGVSNTTYRLTLEGPLQKGRSSWLISGRSSYLNSVDWLNNAELIQWGMNVDRPREVLDEDLVNLETGLVRPNDSDAYFYDLHGKVYLEGRDGGRFVISGYYGGDQTEQQARRLFRTFRFGDENREFRQVTSRNEWDNSAFSLQYQESLSDNIYSHFTGGLSIYRTEFAKDDFTYSRLNRDSGSFQIFIFPFENRSILNELKADQQFNIDLGSLFATAGLTYNYYLGEYFEDSFNRPGFLTTRRSHKIDLYGQFDYSETEWVDASLGSRLHYYSSGQYLAWSPRVKLTIAPSLPVSGEIGYSRNYQFLNKISLSNTVTSDVWIMANEEQPPTTVDYYSAGLYIEPAEWLFAQIEGYLKEYRNVRLHEINAVTLSNTFDGAPWYTDNSGTGRGLELMVRNNWNNWSLAQTFTVSSMQLSNPLINDGEAFYVDWDRTYRYGATLQTEPLDNLLLYLSFVYASGAPNRLATFGRSGDERLDPYRRTDLTLEYKNRFSFGWINASISLFNLFDRRNPWYRELTFVLDRSTTRNRIRTVPVDVYDIGFQPSFNLSFSF